MPSEEIAHLAPEEITEWALNNDPEVPRADDMAKDSDRPRYFWDQIMFVRDDVARGIFGIEKENVSVVGTHSSKSVILPVMHFNWGQIHFVTRYNYYDWCVSIRAPKLMDGIDFLDLFDRNEIGGFFEGFPGEWIFDSLVANDYPLTAQFSFCLSNNQKLWTVCWVIRKWWERRWAPEYGEPPIVIYDL